MIERLELTTGYIEDSAAIEILLKNAREDGHLGLEAIFEVFPEAETDADVLTNVVDVLESKGVHLDADDDHLLEASEAPELRVALDTVDLSALQTNDPVDLYLAEMGQVPLLTHEQEIELARRMEHGARAAQELKDGVQDGGETVRLEKLAQAGEDARRHLIEANTRLVVQVAKRYRGLGLPFLDLIQAGNVGLIRATDKFDYHRGFRFATYATWWIRQSVTRSLSKHGRTIRIPIHMNDRLRRLKATQRRLEQDTGRRPSYEELAAEMKGLSVEDVRWLLRVSRRPKSLNTPVSDDADSIELGDLLASRNTLGPDIAAERHLLADDLRDMLATLTPRESRILRLRYGLGGDGSQTLKEVGKRFGISRERVRQIEMHAMRKLRHPRNARVLREYLS